MSFDPWRPVDIASMWRPIDIASTWRPVDIASTWRPVDIASTWRPIDIAPTWRPIDIRPMWAPVDVREFLGGLQAFPILPDTSIEQVEDALRAAEETDKDSGGWFWLLPDTEQAKLCIYLLELINEFDGFLANVTGTGRLPDGYNSAIRTLCILVAVLIWIIEHQPRNQG